MIWYLLTAKGKEYIVDENCAEIIEHPARGDGDKWFYDVINPDGEGDNCVYRFFDPAEIRFSV